MEQSGNLSVHSGRFINLLDFKAEDIQLEDIASSLSNLCRFGGHTRTFYSVAQHSVRVARALPPELMLDGLLHDAAEAYMVDLPRPLKRLMPSYEVLEKRIHSAVALRFGISPVMHPLVKAADDAALRAEFGELMNVVPPPEWFDGVTPLPTAETFYTPTEAKGAFLITFAEAVFHKLTVPGWRSELN